MPLPIYHLRRLLAATAITLTLVVVGMYLYARMRVQDVRQNVSKLPYEISQTANGFQISKSDGKRTLFKVEASDVKQFKLDGSAQLHNVNIVLYGRDSSRFDRIYGDDFSYNKNTGDVVAKGEVQIDLVGNPAGLTSPDQSAPKELKNPIHLKTSDLIFNKNTGDASTQARVEFQTAQASGWAVGAKYAGKTNVLTLSSQIHVTVNGPNAAAIQAEHGVITGDPRQIVLDRPRLDRESGSMQSDRTVFYLGPENHVERIVATGNVTTQSRVARASNSLAENKSAAANKTSSEIHSRADQAEFLLGGDGNLLHTATLTGNVHFEQTGTQPMEGEAGRVILDFAGQNQVRKVHAVDGARLMQKAANSGPTENGTGDRPQNFELSAPAIDFVVANGRMLRHAETSGAAQITITQQQVATQKSPHPSAQKTVVTAGKFNAEFVNRDGRSTIATMHGAPDARIVNSTAGPPDRVSTSDSVDAMFFPQGGIESITQKGNFVYTDGGSPDKRMQAWATKARYTPSDQMLVLTGSPRVANGGMATTADSIRINRDSGEALAEGDVKTSYSEMKEQPSGALLASSSPIHVTSLSMSANSDSGTALYKGNARLWQDANVIEAPSIQFDRDRRFVVAQGSPSKPVQTILVQKQKDASATADSKPDKTRAPAGSSPIAITATKLTYTDSERKAHYEGGVLAKGADFTAAANTADAYLVSRSESSPGHGAAGPSQLDHMVALGNVLIQQPTRRAEGQKLVYTAADDKFVLTGGPPSIFDAERGKITGVSLTFFRRDDRVLVEGEASTPVVTQTRVAR
jgi:lipopolysaccharide export system protein LptA